VLSLLLICVFMILLVGFEVDFEAFRSRFLWIWDLFGLGKW